MPDVHFMVTGRVIKNGKFYKKTKGYSTSHINARTEFKQLLNSLAQTGIVNEIEDRQSPFNGMLVDLIFVSRPGDEDCWEDVEGNYEDEFEDEFEDE